MQRKEQAVKQWCAFRQADSIAALLAVALACGLASSAAAQQQLSLLSDTVLDSDALLFRSSATYGRAINGVSYQSEALMTVGDYQYATWYHLGPGDEDVYLGRRSLGTTEWEVMDTGVDMTRTTSDAHNVISMGVSGDGVIHLSWDHHGHTLNYMNSDVGAATGGDWSASVFNAPLSSLNPGGSSIGGVTYPRFVTDPTSGDMHLTYRTGSSGNGDTQMATYDIGSGVWSTPHEVNDGTSINVNPYLNGIDVDSTGRFHTTWTYRPGAGSSNYDIMYSYSDDGGASWFNNDRVALGAAVNPTDPGLIIDNGVPGDGLLGQVGLDSSLMNQQTQTVDLDGRVHVVMWHADDANFGDTSGFDTGASDYFHYFRDPVSGDWARTALPNAREVGSRPDIAYDAAGNIYVAYVAPGAGDSGGYYTNGDLVIATASKSSGYNDWADIYTDTRDFAGEPKFDQNRLLADGVLSVYLQENSTASSLTGSPLHVLDFRAESILEWAGGDTGVWDSGVGADWDTTGNGIGDAPFASGSSAWFDDDASVFTVNIANPVAPGATKFSNNAHTYTMTGAGIGGAGDLRVNGGGVVTLANGDNNYTGATHVNRGVLAVSGNAAISASPHISVAAGGALDVTAVSGGAFALDNQTLTVDGEVRGDIVAANNSTVHVNSAFAMSGDLTAQSGSLVTGAGQIAGQLAVQSSAAIRVGAQGLEVGYRRRQIDDFESYSAGDVASGADPPWTAHSGNTHVDIVETGDGNQALATGGVGSSFAGVSRDMPAGVVIGDDDTATFFFRFNAQTDAPNHNFGLADRADTGGALFSDFEAQVRLTADTDGNFKLDARDGGGFTAPLATGLSTGTWYNVWMVVDQATDTYDLYLNNGQSDASGAERIATSLGFRNGTTFDLSKILGIGDSSDIGGPVRYDDLYYADGQDLTNPLSSPGDLFDVAGETLTVTGDVTLEPGSTLQLDLFDATACDKLVVGGRLTAGGTLQVTLDSLAPSLRLGDSFDILDFASATGAFDIFVLPGLAAELAWDISSLYTDGVLSVAVAPIGLAGDYNGDGVVDAGDYTVWRDNLGGDASALAAGSRDGSLSGPIHTADYTFWKNNFGATADPPGAIRSVEVPEPATGLLALFVGIAVSGCPIVVARPRRQP